MRMELEKSSIGGLPSFGLVRWSLYMDIAYLVYPEAVEVRYSGIV